MPSSRPWWLFAAPAIFLLLWSGGYTVAKVALQYAPPMTVLVLRYGSVVAIMLVLLLILRPPLPQTKAGWGHLAFTGFLIQTVYFGMTYLAFINGVAAGTAALIMSIQPIIVALVAIRWSGERTSNSGWLGLALGLAGTAIVITARSEIEAPPVAGLALAFLGLGGITLATLWEKRFGLSYHPVTANLIGYAAGLVGVFPFLLIMEGGAVDWSPAFFAAMFYLVIGNSVIAVGLLLMMIRAGEVAKVSALFFLVPPLAAVIAWAVLGEIMPPLAWLGLAIAGLGVWMATRRT